MEKFLNNLALGIHMRNSIEGPHIHDLGVPKHRIETKKNLHEGYELPSAIGSLIHILAQRTFHGDSRRPMPNFINSLNTSSLSGQVGEAILRSATSVGHQVMEKMYGLISPEYKLGIALTEVTFGPSPQQTKIIYEALHDEPLQLALRHFFRIDGTQYADLREMTAELVSDPNYLVDTDMKDMQLTYKGNSSPTFDLIPSPEQSKKTMSFLDMIQLVKSAKDAGVDFSKEPTLRLMRYVVAVVGYQYLNLYVTNKADLELETLPEKYRELVLSAHARTDFIMLSVKKDATNQRYLTTLLKKFQQVLKKSSAVVNSSGTRHLLNADWMTPENIHAQHRLIEALKQGDIALTVVEMKVDFGRQSHSIQEKIQADLAHNAIAMWQYLLLLDSAGATLSDYEKIGVKSIQPGDTDSFATLRHNVRATRALLESPHQWVGMHVRWSGLFELRRQNELELNITEQRRVVDGKIEYTIRMSQPQSPRVVSINTRFLLKDTARIGFRLAQKAYEQAEMQRLTLFDRETLLPLPIAVHSPLGIRPTEMLFSRPLPTGSVIALPDEMQGMKKWRVVAPPKDFRFPPAVFVEPADESINEQIIAFEDLPIVGLEHILEK